jgi:hypothetical protein
MNSPIVHVADLGDDHHEMWLELIGLAKSPPAPWTLIGAQMVSLHAWSAGREPNRLSRDADTLVNVRLAARGAEHFAKRLADRGFEQKITPMGIGHRFTRGPVAIDVLAPDHLGASTRPRVGQGTRTIEVPGGTRALQRSQPMTVVSRSETGDVPTPDLLGAIIVKVRAIAVDDAPAAQRADVALLLSLVHDAGALAIESSSRDRKHLRRHGAFGDPTSACWRKIPDAEHGALVYRRLIRKPHEVRQPSS